MSKQKLFYLPLPLPASLPISAALPMRQPPRAQRGRPLSENSTLPEHIHIRQTLPAQDTKQHIKPSQTEIKFSDVLPSLPHTHTYLTDEQGHCTSCFIPHQTTTYSTARKEENSLPYFILVVLVGSDLGMHMKAFYSNSE